MTFQTLWSKALKVLPVIISQILVELRILGWDWIYKCTYIYLNMAYELYFLHIVFPWLLNLLTSSMTQH